MKSHLVKLIIVPACVLVVLSMSGFTGAQVPHFGQNSADPIVAIAVDATTSRCVSTRILYRHNVLLKKTTFACLPGTTIEVVHVRRSQAVAQHEDYVVRPTASSAAGSQLDQEIQQLVSRKRSELRHDRAASPSSNVTKATNCWDGGITTEILSNDYPDGDRMEEDVQYYISSNCSNIFIDYNSVELASNYNNPMYWNDAQYPVNCCWDAVWEPNPLCPSVAPEYHTYQIDINSTEPYGNDFTDEYNYNNGIGGYCAGGNTWDVDIGTLN